MPYSLRAGPASFAKTIHDRSASARHSRERKSPDGCGVRDRHRAPVTRGRVTGTGSGEEVPTDKTAFRKRGSILAARAVACPRPRVERTVETGRSDRRTTSAPTLLIIIGTTTIHGRCRARQNSFVSIITSGEKKKTVGTCRLLYRHLITMLSSASTIISSRCVLHNNYTPATSFPIG